LNILIANVASIRVNEIKVLAEALNKKHKITVISLAMDGALRGLAFSYKEPVRCVPLMYKEIVQNTSYVWQEKIASVEKGANEKKVSEFDGIPAYEFYGTPADAVSIALTEILKHKKPDLVICGLHNGMLLGQDVFCSSNMAMAMESSFHGIPAIAVGVEHVTGGHSAAELAIAAEFIEKNAERFARLKLPKCTFLYIGVPTVSEYKDLKGVKAVRLGFTKQTASFTEREDASGEKYYWANYFDHSKFNENGENSARTWLDRKFVTLVPICYDATDYAAVSSWGKSISEEMRAFGGEEASTFYSRTRRVALRQALLHWRNLYRRGIGWLSLRLWFRKNDADTLSVQVGTRCAFSNTSF
jgi:5'-nucleotidase